MTKLKNSHDMTQEEMEESIFQRRKPEPFVWTTFMYNDKDGTVMGRTGTQWGKKMHRKMYRQKAKQK